LLQLRADVVRDREEAAARESYTYRLRELQDRSREQELTRLAREPVHLQTEASQLSLFEDINEATRGRVQEIEEQMGMLRQNVERTRELLTRERDRRLKVILPRRFKLA
jgi:hypothetical protein